MFVPKRFFLYVFLFVALGATAQHRNPAFLSYIDQYYDLAQKQQQEHKIPASIVLAQGLLESSAGQSDFAKQSNNHFGIKCNNNWTGDKIYHDDDAKGECFRKYDRVLDSYEDHSTFLKSRPRYASLFYLNPTDYEGWAHGLKKAGYATDPAYGYKLVSIIEDYNLHRFDLGDKVVGAPKSPTVIKHRASMGSIQALTSHAVFRVHKVQCVTSYIGDTYAMIAEEFGITENKIRAYNEVGSTDSLTVGTRVFIEPKKNKAPTAYETHVVQDGESMYSIAQYYAIKVQNLYLLNNMPFADGASFGQVLKLR